MRSLHGCLLAGLLGLLGCPSRSPPALAAPALRVIVDAPDLIEVPPGETLAVPVRVELADGTPASGYALSAYLDCADTGGCQAFVTLKGTGKEQVLLSGKQANASTFTVRADPADGRRVTSREHRAVFLAASGDTLQAAVSSAQLAVGERRPFAAQSHSPGGLLGRHRSAPTRPTYAVTDAQVAQVDEEGVVTALAPGQTTLQITLGTQTAQVPLTVDPRLTLGPPAEGSWNLQAAKPGLTGEVAVVPGAPGLEYGLQVDSHGSPHAMLRFGSRAVVASWTGSGFGTELLPDAFDYTLQASLAIDARDHLYVVTRAASGVAVYDKPLGAPPSAWRRRALDTHVAELERAGLVWTRYYPEEQESAVALLARAGGGLHVAYKVKVESQGYAYSCGTVYRYAEVTDDAAETADLTSDWYFAGEQGRCNEEGPAPAPHFGLARAADGQVQFLLPFGDREAGSVETFNMGIGTYSRDDGGHWSAPPGVPLPQASHFPRPGVITSLNVFSPETEDGGAPVSQVFDGLAYQVSAAPYLVAGQGRLYTGYNLTGPLQHFAPFEGAQLLDDPSATWTDGPILGGDDRITQTVHGVASQRGQLHFLADLSVGGSTVLGYLNRRIPQPDAHASDPEPAGRRLQDVLRTPDLHTPPVRLPDGTRVALGFGAESGQGLIFRSAAGQPWAGVVQQGAFSQESELVAAGTQLFAFSYRNALVRSADQGATWEEVSPMAQPQTGGFLHMLVVPGAGAVADFGDKLVVSSGDPSVASVTWTDVPLSQAVAGGRVLETYKSSRTLVPTAGGFYFVVTTFFAHTTRQLLVRKLGWDGGVLWEHSYADLPADEEPQLDGAAVAEGGALVFVSTSTLTAGLPVLTHRVDLETGAWSVGHTGAALLSASNPVALTGGGFALGGELDPHTPGVFHRSRAVVQWSADGLAWSAPQLLRPNGGDAQDVKLAMADGTGQALLVVRDNFSMTPVVNVAPKVTLLQTAVKP